MTKYSKREVMTLAHKYLKEFNSTRKSMRARLMRRGESEESFNKSHPNLKPISMSEALKMAWKTVKANAKISDEDRLFRLKMKDLWDRSDFELAEELEQRISEKAA